LESNVPFQHKYGYIRDKVASYDLRPGNGAGPYSGRRREEETEEEIEEEKVR